MLAPERRCCFEETIRFQTSLREALLFQNRDSLRLFRGASSAMSLEEHDKGPEDLNCLMLSRKPGSTEEVFGLYWSFILTGKDK